MILVRQINNTIEARDTEFPGYRFYLDEARFNEFFTSASLTEKIRISRSAFNPSTGQFEEGNGRSRSALAKSE